MWLLVTLLTLYVTAMLVLRFSTWVQQAVTFVHHVRQPFFQNYSDHASFGLTGTIEFKLYHEDGCEIEVWHILPTSYHDSIDSESPDAFVEALSDDAPILLYLHGNTGTRAITHRIELYKFMTQKGYHLLTFDYRGFANSECYPSERGMMEDAQLLWNWLKDKAPTSKVYIWGHSLGSAAATYLTKELCETGSLPDGLILDAPFTDITDAGANHPLSTPFWPIMPIFKYLVLDSFVEKFQSVERVKHITCPMLILHGRLDRIIPYHIGEKFYRMAMEYKKDHPNMGEIEFVDCGDSAHKTNYRSPSTQEALKRFIKA